MIHTQNSVPRPISRLDSLMNELINESKESLSCQPLIDPYIPNSIDWNHESCHFGNSDSISSYQPELYQNQTLDILVSYSFSEIENVNLSLNLVNRV